MVIISKEQAILNGGSAESTPPTNWIKVSKGILRLTAVRAACFFFLSEHPSPGGGASPANNSFSNIYHRPFVCCRHI